MAELNPSGKFWALVTLGAAALGSPLLVHFGNPKAGESEQRPIEVVVKTLVEPATSQQTPPPSTTTPPHNDRLAYTPPRPAPVPPPAEGSGLASSQRYLSTAELEGFSNWQLDIARNEIYARHGRRFRRADLQRYFDAQGWYRPVYGPDEFSEEQLNPFEQYNANLIADFQRQRYGGR